MEPPKYFSLKKTILLMVVGLVVFGVYLFFFVGFNQIIEVLETINPVQYGIYYSAAILTVLASVFFWSAAWKTILQNLSIDISYRRAYFFYWIGSFADLVIPCATVCGEVTRLYLVEKDTKADYGIIATSAVTNRIVAYTIVTAGLSIGSVIALSKSGVPGIIVDLLIILVIGAAAYLAVLLTLALSKKSSGVIMKAYLSIYHVLRRQPTQTKIDNTRKTLDSFYEGFERFRNSPKYLIKPFVFHAAAYIMGLMVFVFVFLALGINYVSFGFYIVVYFVAGAFQDAAASFSVGSLEVLLAVIFSLYGVNSATSAVAAVVVRTVSFWLPLFVSFACVQLFGMRAIYANRAVKQKLAR